MDDDYDDQPPFIDSPADIAARVAVLENKVEQLLEMLNEMVDRVNAVSAAHRKPQAWR